MQPGAYGNVETMVKLCGQQRRIDTGSGKGENRAAIGRISRAVDRYAGNVSQRTFRLIEQFMLMPIESRKTPFTYELDAGMQSGDAREIVGTRFKTVRHDQRLFFSSRVAAGPPLGHRCEPYVWRRIQQPRPSRPHQPLMAGNRQQVNGTAFHVNRQIPCRLRRINQKQCSGFAAESGQLPYRLNSAADIGYMADGDHSRIYPYGTADLFGRDNSVRTGRYD